MSRVDRARRVAESVNDPEVPVLTLGDLGVIRDIYEEDGCAVVCITPTYSGCPASDYINTLVSQALEQAGIKAVIKTVLSPAWTTDWLSEDGKQKLRAYGIAPPVDSQSDDLFFEPTVPCPNCQSTQTRQLAEFGSTPCKAHYQCLTCKEPFDYFKCFKRMSA